MSAVQADELLLAPHQIYSYGQLDMARESNWGCAIIKSAVRTDGLLHYPSSNVFVWMTRESNWGCLIIWPTQYLISRGQRDFLSTVTSIVLQNGLQVHEVFNFF